MLTKSPTMSYNGLIFFPVRFNGSSGNLKAAGMVPKPKK